MAANRKLMKDGTAIKQSKFVNLSNAMAMMKNKLIKVNAMQHKLMIVWFNKSSWVFIINNTIMEAGIIKVSLQMNYDELYISLNQKYQQTAKVDHILSQLAFVFINSFIFFYSMLRFLFFSKTIIKYQTYFAYKRNTSYSTYNISSIMQNEKEVQSTDKIYTIKENNTELFAEGHAKIYTSYLEKNSQGQTIENQVFYNPVQIFNRDLSVLAMQGYIHLLQEERKEKFVPVSIADCLSASGLRTIRYLKELQGVGTVFANDLLPAAHKLMQDNFTLNGLDSDKYRITLQDANILLRTNQFDIVDLDPYGSVVPFLDAAVSSAKEGAMLCITCTDTRVLCGPDLVKCYYYYGATRAKVHDFNENALRILLATISSAASRQCKFIEPLFSLQTDFYVRVFVRIGSGKKECGQTGAKIGNIYNCQFCGNYQYKTYFKPKKNHFVPERTICESVNCPVCQHPYQLNGPVWLDPINSPSFVQKILTLLNDQNSKLPLSTKKKINGVLQGVLAEGELSKIPLAFNFDLMNKTLHSVGLSKKALLAAVKSLGKQHLITPSYLSPGLYKTSLPLGAIYDIIKAYKLQQMGADKFLSNVTAPHAMNILKAEIKYKPDFTFQTQEKFANVPRFISMGKGMGPKGKAGKRVVEQQGQIQQKQLKNEDVKQKEQSLDKEKQQQKQEQNVEFENGSKGIKKVKRK